MSGKYLLDTSTLVDLINKDTIIPARLTFNEEVFIPSIALGELYYGAFKSTHTQENVKRLDQISKTNTIIGCDTATARIYGNIKNTLIKKGKPIPENDIWIAAIAQQHQLTLVTRDKHYDYVENLTIEMW